MKLATKAAGELIKPRIKAEAPSRGGKKAKRQPGARILNQSVKVRQSRGKGLFSGESIAYVTPMAPHRHLIIRGHRIVTPGGRDTGRRTKPNPFVDRAAKGFEKQAADLVHRYWKDILR